MAAQIGTSLATGFRTANKSWPAIGVYAAGWVILAVLGFLAVMLTNPTAGLLEGAAANTPELEAAQAQALIGWLGRAWPLLLLMAVVYLLATAWMTAAQLGYVTRLVRTQQAGLKDFLESGMRHLGRVLGALGLGLVIGIAAFALFIGVAALLEFGSTALRVVGALALVAAVVAMIWLGVRMAFWWIAIVADGLKPIAGLKAGFHATKKRWWKTFALLLVLGLINAGVSIVCRLFIVIGTMVGGVGGVVVAAIGALPMIVWSFYFAFMFSAALVRHYDDSKSAAAAA